MVRFSRHFQALSAAFLFAGLGVIAHPTKRSQCASTLATAANVANNAYNTYWTITISPPGYAGQFSSTLWINANALEDVHNLMLGAGSDQFANLAVSSTLGHATEGAQNWSDVIAGSYDDAQWVILALWKMADYLNARGNSQTAAHFISSAETIYDIVAGQWDTTTCGGGVWWSSAHNYKNAITNQLFLLTSASGYLRNNNPVYLANANKVWNWLKNSGMRNPQGLWNDGLSSTCQNNGQTTWTYNQGVIASGLAALSVANKDPTLLDQAEITLDATIKYLTTNNILKEPCDNAAGAASCDADQRIFKGIWMKHVQYYLDNANDPSRTAKYSGFLGAQESAVVHYATGANYAVGSVWYAPNQGGSVFGAEPEISGLAAHVSAAKYGPC